MIFHNTFVKVWKKPIACAGESATAPNKNFDKFEELFVSMDVF